MPPDKLQFFKDRIVSELLKLKGAPTLPLNDKDNVSVSNDPFSGLMTSVADVPQEILDAKLKLEMVSLYNY